VSVRAKVAAVIASAGVLGAGWAVGTANGSTLAGGTTTGTTSGTTSTSTTGTTGTTGTTATPSTSAGSATTGASTTKTTSSSGSYKDGTYTGTTVTHRYGSVTVAVTISGGKITNVTANTATDGDRRSESINSQAIPIMKSEVLAADSAKVSTVSGATYTTTAYLTSLQSALAKA
jgi:uncharacterized protein with FMN-binding domain